MVRKTKQITEDKFFTHKNSWGKVCDPDLNLVNESKKYFSLHSLFPFVRRLFTPLFRLDLQAFPGPVDSVEVSDRTAGDIA